MNHVGLSAACGVRRTTTDAPVSVVQRMKRTLGTLTAVCALAVGLGSCANELAYDPSGASKKDYEGLIGRRGQDKLDAKVNEAPPIPAFQSVLAAPSAPELADTRRVSLAVTETTPVRDILIELARKAEVDLELDPRISGGVIMSITDRPFIDVIERVVDLAELRYTFERNVLKVELDDPYLEQYRMDVLNQSRESSSFISSSTDASSGAGAGGGGGNNASASAVTSKSSNDFWLSIGKNIDQILASIQSRRGDAARSADAVNSPMLAAESEEAPQPGQQAQPDAAAPKELKAAQQLAEDQQSAAAESDAGGTPLKAGASAGRGGGAVAQTNYSVNPQSGIITVFANKRQQKEISRYLRSVHTAISQQVLIEAKVLEITLNDQFRTGVDWQAFLGPNNDLSISGNFNRSVTALTGTPTIGVNWANSDGDLNIAAQLVKQFGTVRTLSSPRLTVLNNQAAVLKVARNQIFFELDVTATEPSVTLPNGKITVNSEIKSVPVGLIMNVMPTVDPVTKRISMNIRPSITRISGFVEDPGVPVALAQTPAGSASGISSQIPIIDVREMDSIVTLDSGQTIVMGGLMQESSETQREGLPGAMDIPVLGNALSQNLKSSVVTELVVFIRATVVDNGGTVADEDIRLYKTFTPDPRPIAF